mgnify:CR=1 FL=1|tara:strand:+ start:966 stop:1136 length:171 start_codon:yes stop_codon:yes gene_type:complete
MTDTCLQLAGVARPKIVERPFARNLVFLAMRCAAASRPVLPSQSATGTSIGTTAGA